MRLVSRSAHSDLGFNLISPRKLFPLIWNVGVSLVVGRPFGRHLQGSLPEYAMSGPIYPVV